MKTVCCLALLVCCVAASPTPGLFDFFKGSSDPKEVPPPNDEKILQDMIKSGPDPVKPPDGKASLRTLEIIPTPKEVKNHMLDPLGLFTQKPHQWTQEEKDKVKSKLPKLEGGPAGTETTRLLIFNDDGTYSYKDMPPNPM